MIYVEKVMFKIIIKMLSGGEKSFNSGAISRPDLDEQFIMAHQIQSRRRKQSQSLRGHVQRILQAS
jgi:hypothetical protein